jgi:DNA replication protein DnaC
MTDCFLVMTLHKGVIKMKEQINLTQELEQLLSLLKLPVCLKYYQQIAEKAEKEGSSYIEFLHEIILRESEYRNQKRIDKLLKDAKLPRDKLLSDFDMTRIPGLAPSQVQRLAEGEFIDRCGNVLIFGNPGTGKSHLSMALAREWCLLGRRVCFYTAAKLVELLLQAKSALKLDQFIKKLDRFEVLLIDDISYNPFDRQETDVLFTLLAARYEMRSLMITSNLPFSKWDAIFRDEMTTNAAIDRLVHHSVILELNALSYRAECAQNKQEKPKRNAEKINKKEAQGV